jgi:hypothetical protein
MKKAQKNQDSDIDTDVVNASGGGKPIKVADFRISESYIDKIKEEAKKFSIVDTEINDILNILKDLKDKTVKVENKPEKSIFLLGKTSLGKNLFLNIPIKNNGVNLRGLNKLLSVGSDFKNCGFAYARPNKPFITNGIDIKLKLTN